MVQHYLPLQKDLEVHRRQVDRPTGRYEYILLHKGTLVGIRKDNRILNYAAVYVDRNGQIILDSMRTHPACFESYILEDNRTFIIPVSKITPKVLPVREKVTQS